MTTWVTRGNGESTVWQAPCETWQIDVVNDELHQGPRLLRIVDEAFAEHVADCLTCSRALRDQRAERDRKAKEAAEAERKLKERKVHVNVLVPLILKALDETTDPVARAVLDHHKPNTESRWMEGCDGCDPGSYAEDLPDWPCSTVVTVAKALGHEWPDDAWLWDGKR